MVVNVDNQPLEEPKTLEVTTAVKYLDVSIIQKEQSYFTIYKSTWYFNKMVRTQTRLEDFKISKEVKMKTFQYKINTNVLMTKL